MYKRGRGINRENVRGPAHINLSWPEEIVCILLSLHLCPPARTPSSLPPFYLRSNTHSLTHHSKTRLTAYFTSPRLPPPFTLFTLSLHLSGLSWSNRFPTDSPLHTSPHLKSLFLRDVKCVTCVKGVLDTWWAEGLCSLTNCCFNSGTFCLTASLTGL